MLVSVCSSFLKQSHAFKWEHIVFEIHERQRMTRRCKCVSDSSSSFDEPNNIILDILDDIGNPSELTICCLSFVNASMSCFVE
jgi:hypothetical protein